MPVQESFGSRTRRLAGKALPGLLDSLGPAVELFANPREPDPSQRALNSLIVGGGDLATSIVTGGLDIPAQLLQASRFIYNAAERDPDSAFGRLQRGAEVFDPANYLRIASQAIGQGTFDPQGEDVEYSKDAIKDGIKALNMDAPKYVPMAPSVGGPMFMPRL
jgi:hypothetical protein